MDAPRKLTYKELVAGMVPFLNFPETEQEVRQAREERVRQASETNLLPLDRPGTASDIVEFLDAAKSGEEYRRLVNLILTVVPGSLETLDRVCMVICPDERTWAQRRQSAQATQRIAEFLIEPSDTEAIPWYTAERFRLPSDWAERIQSNIVTEIHNSLQSLYSTRTGLAMEQVIGKVVTDAGYTWGKGFVEIVDQKEVDVAVPDLRLPRVLVMASYNLTTASSQSARAREQQSMYKSVRDYNSLRVHANRPDVQLVNVIDGGGWLARLKDLEQMHQHCDYALAFSQLEQLTAILHFHMNQ